MRRVPIRMKLAAALAVPLSALVAVTTIEVVNAADEAAEVASQRALVEITLGPASILSAIENERNAAGVYMLGQEENFALRIEDPEQGAAETDTAIEDFRAEVARQGGSVAEAYAPAFDALDQLDELRAEVMATPDSQRNLANVDAVVDVFDRYTEIRSVLVEANERVANAIDDPVLRQGVQLIALNAQQTDLIAHLIRDLLLATLVGDPPNGVDTPEEIGSIAEGLARLHDTWDTIAASGTGPYAEHVERLLASEEVREFSRVVEEALSTGQVDLIAAFNYSTGDDPENLPYTIYGEGVKQVVREEAAEIEKAAVARQRWFLVLAAAAIVVAALAAWLVSRSITRPLRALTRQAKEMAERRLPEAVSDILETPLGEDVVVPSVEPISVATRDEVADVADALNTVQDSALDLAVEQAVLRRNIADSFVNLGRRNQNLLGRQLDFITELESKETDPDTLANLFRLDHLATRMRRNAESLLVLAGVEPPRKWAAPVRLTDVIRAALGEVEDYQRVTVRGVEPATIVGSAAADVAHLLAELIENALVFSPPDQTVDIRGRGNDDGGYTLAIIDSGLGMSPEDIAAANRRLAGLESFTIAPSKYLGHYVAGNLAARHGIKVRLDNSPGNGITATVELPPTLLTTDTTNLAAPVTPPHGIRALPTTTPTPDDTTREPGAPSDQGAAGPSATTPPAPSSPAAPTEGTAPRRPGGFAGGQPTQRTASGLVKRTPRVVEPDGAGDRGGRDGARPPAAPPASEDLLATLERVPSLQARRAGGPEGGGPGTGGPAGGPGVGGGGFGAPGGGGPGAGGPWPGRPAPTAPAPPPPGPAPTPGVGGAGRPGGPVPGPATPAGSPPGRPAPGGDGGDGMTPSGLPRRVRGAQMPNLTPLSLRRGTGSGDGQPPADGQGAAPTPPPAPAPGPAGPAAGDGGAAPRSGAQDVYDLLSRFSAGVRRGLEESGRNH